MDLLANFRIHLHFFVDVASSWNPFYKCKIQLHLNSETVASSIIITHMFVLCFTKYRLQLRACRFSSPVGFMLHSAQSWSYLLIVCLHSTENGYAKIPLQALNKQLCLNLEADSSRQPRTATALGSPITFDCSVFNAAVGLDDRCRFLPAELFSMWIESCRHWQLKSKSPVSYTSSFFKDL